METGEPLWIDKFVTLTTSRRTASKPTSTRSCSARKASSALRWLEERTFFHAGRDYELRRPTRCTPALFGAMFAELDEVRGRWRVMVTPEE